jgi:hypothetical protein
MNRMAPTRVAMQARVAGPARQRPAVSVMGGLCRASGVLGVLAGAVTLAYPAAVTQDRWSYPFGYSAGLLMGIGLAATHVMTGLGVRGLMLIRAGVGAATERVALAASTTGFLLLAICEIAGGLIGRAATEDARAVIVDSAFGVASMLTAAGAVVAAAGLRRAPEPGAAHWLLASAVVMTLLVTPANMSGNEVARMVTLIVWSLCFVPLGSSVRRLAQVTEE